MLDKVVSKVSGEVVGELQEGLDNVRKEVRHIDILVLNIPTVQMNEGRKLVEKAEMLMNGLMTTLGVTKNDNEEMIKNGDYLVTNGESGGSNGAVETQDVKLIQPQQYTQVIIGKSIDCSL